MPHIVEHDRSVVDEALACTVEAAPVFRRSIIFAQNVVEFNGAGTVPPEHLQNKHTGGRRRINIYKYIYTSYTGIKILRIK